VFGEKFHEQTLALHFYQSVVNVDESAKIKWNAFLHTVESIFSR